MGWCHVGTFIRAGSIHCSTRISSTSLSHPRELDQFEVLSLRCFTVTHYGEGGYHPGSNLLWGLWSSPSDYYIGYLTCFGQSAVLLPWTAGTSGSVPELQLQVHDWGWTYYFPCLRATSVGRKSRNVDPCPQTGLACKWVDNAISAVPPTVPVELPQSSVSAEQLLS